jgi:Ca2+-binding RTX toxin-like protein
VLIGGLGNDTLSGGNGTDTASYDSAAAAVVLNLGLSTAQTTGGAGIDTLISIENLIGSAFEDTLTGNSGANRIDGGAGADVINGAGGNDELDGGEGADIYMIAAAGDRATGEIDDTGASGADELRFAAIVAGTLVVYDDDAGLERIVIGTGTASNAVLTGATALNIDASRAANGLTLIGNAGINSIIGSAFADKFDGGAGDDTLTGGGGDDTLTGGAGNDRFVIDSGNDAITDFGGADILVISALATATATIRGVWTATSATTNAGTASLTTAGFAVHLGAATGTAGFSVTNTGAATTITGSALADTLTGGTGADKLEGGGGGDRLSGGAGNDTLIGEHGDDTYVIDGGDTIIEAANGGLDTVFSFAKHTLAANIENLVLTGTAAISGTGNGLNNRLTGNTGANILDGGGGNDTLIGGDGADRLSGSVGTDQMWGGSGADNFVFKAENESGNELALADIIADFVRGQDRIDLSAIDASSLITGNNAFVWMGIAATTSSTSGELRFQQFDNDGTDNDYTLVYADTDADTSSEFMIKLVGLYDLTASDFIL